MRQLCLLVVPLLILLGCSTTSKKNFSSLNPEFLPPESANWPINDQLSAEKDFESLDIYLNRVAKENPSLNTGWWADYRRAQLWMKKDKNVSCENFSRLAQDMRFPLRRVAFLHAHEVCPKDNQILQRLEAFQVDTFDPWLTDAAVTVAVEKAKALNDHAKLVELYLKKSKSSTRREEKVAFCDQAMKQAQKIGDKNKIHEIESRIYNLSPSRMPAPKAKDYLAVAADFRYLRKFDQSRAYYNKIIGGGKSFSLNDKLQAYRGLRLSYKIQQQRPEALKTTEDLAKFVEKNYKHSKKMAVDARLYADTELQLARTYWTNDKVELANKTLVRTEKTVRGRTSLAEEFWMHGRMAEERQDFRSAIDWFRKALMETPDSNSSHDRISWYLAWNDRKAQNYDDAIQIFRDLKKKTDNPYDRNRFSFWLAKTLADKKQPAALKEADDEYAAIIKDDALGFYGLLSHRELGLPLPMKKIRDDAGAKKSPYDLTHRLGGMLDLAYFEWLTATHETEVARNYLDSVARSLRKDAPSDLDSWYSLFQLYAKSQNYLALFNQLNSLESTDRRAMLDQHPQLLFPSPYSETVTQAAGRFGVSPEFIYSIMRQESSFNPQARSQMDAFGLMQLLPEVAKRSADANYIDYHAPEDLYEPYVNIPIGSAYLRELWDKYNGEIILAVASYNASADAIENWRRTRFRGDTLEFIEDIPYDETRDYVKLVLRNLIAYELLSTRDDKMNFPEWTLKISAAEKTASTHAPASTTEE